MNIQSSMLLTDLYQLTMLQSYVEKGMDEPAVFEFFSRKMPPQRGFFVAAGLEQLMEFLSTAHFTPWELEWLESTKKFSKSFVEYLARFQFSGDVHAMPEGTVFFVNEPIVRVTAPMPQAQLIETRLINLLQYQTVVASKAARCVLVAGGKPIIDFGLRRAHGAEAGLLAARASYLVGFASTATVLAGAMYGIPVVGTMAHSYIQAHQSETQAFEDFAESHPGNVILLIDTYDTEKGAEKVVALAPALKQKGITIQGVRLDSGDLADHAFKVRRILDEGGLYETRITASGNLDEFAIQKLMAANAPIDFFAVGTKVTTSADAPYLDCAYKLQQYAGRPCRKRSEGKATWPGPKQVYRYYDNSGQLSHDILTLEEDIQGGEPLLRPVMESGKRLDRPEPLSVLRDRTSQQLARLPAALRELKEGVTVEMRVSQRLKDLASKLDAEMVGVQ